MSKTTTDTKPGDQKPGVNEPGYDLNDLIYLMGRLRDPKTGCPWDLKQSYETIVPSTLEEVYEVVDAIERKDYDHLKEELGDLLFQIIFYTQLASEEERFTLSDVIHSLTSKLVRRHPHVFPDGTLSSTLDNKATQKNAEQLQKIKANWEKTKEEERSSKGLAGILDDVPLALTSMNRAAKLQKRASRVGFDWTNIEDVFKKIDEEIAELKEAITLSSKDNSSSSKEHIKEEFGDLLFSCVNLSRHLKIDADQSLRYSSAKFETRIRAIEKVLTQKGLAWESQSEAELDQLWENAKRVERNS